ncbi:MAG: RIP metalloprotease RseP [Clostridia bacterium]|nr:RIP metalloprotease RseP [Clostridia bacterium]
MGFLIGALKIIIVLGTLITIHEAGHFFVAKACNVKVHKFAIGFGPKIFTKQGKETEYTLRLIPFGGFVQMEGEEEASEDDRAFNKKPIWQRVLIVAAGATVNIVFALIVYFFISTSTNIYYGTTITSLANDTPEYISGLRSGDKVVRVNGKKALVGYDIERMIEKSKKDEFLFEVERNNNIQEIDVKIPISTKGLLGIRYDKDRNVAGIVEDTPAYTSGLQSGDKILEINGITINSWEQISEIINKIPDSDITLKVARNNQEIDIHTKTISTTDRFYNLQFDAIRPAGFDSIIYAINETGDYFSATIDGIITLFKGKTENVEVMGPVGIAEQITSTSSFLEFFYLMSAISLSLGIFNLLPIPALDGGKILILIIEKIRRKPMKQETEAKLTLIGFSLIILLAIVVTSTDIIGLINH